MICKYRVTLEGIKGFYRVYTVNSTSSLYTFHKQLRSDLEFPIDQPILFKAFDAEGNVAARYALIDLGFGTVDSVCIGQTVKEGITKFQYFYDISSKKYVIITFESEESGSVESPAVIDSKGPVPLEFENGYVAFEDLPEQKRKLHPAMSDENDDEEDDEEEGNENEDKEEEEIIYDEDEK